MSKGNTATVIVPSQKAAARSSLRIHAFLAIAIACMFAVGVTGCALTHVHIPILRTDAICDLTIACMLFLPVAYAHAHQHERVRDTICFLFWAKLIVEASATCVVFAARLRMPLQDARLAEIDRMLGVNVASIHAWSEAHRLAAAINFTYPQLEWYLIAAIVLPIVFKKQSSVREFFIINVLSMLFMLPLFLLVPAIGPWSVYHFAPNVPEAECQKHLLLLRGAGPITCDFFGIVAFPSMHVFWAVICARTLSSIRWLRIPAIVFSSLIVLSTMTMGWHYFSDVMGGLLLAFACIAAARIVLRSIADPAVAALAILAEIEERAEKKISR